MLKTERLLLREFTLDDDAFIYDLLNSPLFIKNIGDRGVRTKQDAKHYLTETVMKSYLINGFGMYAVVIKSSNKIIGLCGLVYRDDLPEPDIAFAFLPHFIGKGYAHEAACSVISYAKDKLKIAQLLAITSKDNIRSINLLNKLGFKFEKVIERDGKEILLLRNDF
ncbi:MAG: GNAT family N-acetyltransferase [Endozoicomonas sp. (ex Botrylloides leachii)]|nr:GNAT family N-acetyltransferase [Endozoicomonas sp. (ex Botrylloides leachii)]